MIKESCKYKIIMVYPYDPLNVRPGGGIKYVDLLFNNLLNNKIDAYLMGVNLIGSYNNKKRIRFESILNKSDNCWVFLILLALRLPFLEIESNTIIHSHRSYFLLPFILFKPKNPKIVTLHGKTLEIIKTSKYNGIYSLIDYFFKKLEKFCLKRIDIHVAVSNDVKSFFEKKHCFLYNKVVVIPTGINLKLFKTLNKIKLRAKYGFEESEKIILFVGRLEKIKNIDFLLRAFSIVEKNIEKSKLVIVGDGIEKNNLKSLANQLKLNNVIFLGNQKPEVMPEIYNLASLLALCSQSEASPTVIKEAIACGIPIVSTNVGDVEDIIIDKSIGKVIRNKNESEYAKAIIDVLNMNSIDKKKFETMRLKFDFEFITEKYIELYNLIGNTKFLDKYERFER